MKTIGLVFFLLLGTAWADSDFDAGNRAYDEGNFLEARQHYEAQVARGEWTANLFYNLGNADQRLGAMGLAMLNYERALALRPGHPEARANLVYLREQAKSEVSPLNWQTRVFNLLTFDRWLVLATVAGWGTLFLLLRPWLFRRKLTGSAVAGMVCAAGFAALAGFGAWRTFGELSAAIVVVQEAEALEAPAERAPRAETLPVGSRVQVLSTQGDWHYCALPGGVTAWLPAKAIERIRI